jgi:hypothetical protein
MTGAGDGPLDAVVAFASAQEARELRAEAAAAVAKYGANPYSDFILKHGRRPDRLQAAAIGRLIGGRVRAFDGSLQPTRTKTERAAARDAKMARDADLRLDLELNRALDAIAFLAKNEIDPSPLIARISPVESAAVSENIQKAVLWLNRFANEWISHVNIGNEEAEGASTGIGNRIERRGLRLVRSRDSSA